MKTTNSKPVRNFLPRRILLLVLFISCFGLSAYSQNLFTIEFKPPTDITLTQGCDWTKVEAFNGTLSLGQTSGVFSKGNWYSLSCQAQASSLTHVIITPSGGCGTIQLNLTSSSTNLCSTGCDGLSVSLTSSTASLCGFSGQLYVVIQ